MVVNDYFGPIRINIPHATPNYGPGNISLKLIITNIHIVLHKKYLISEITGKTRSKSNVLS